MQFTYRNGILKKYSILTLVLSMTCISMNGQGNGEAHRPLIHFTPETGWMNDPNGLIYYDGYYHMFYQYYPDSTVWGPMHWGHAQSLDLMTWERQPIALYPDSLGWIFSGSAVIDVHNTAGFGNNAMVAIFTYHNDAIWQSGNKNTESQGLAYSTDKGATWKKYVGNPVLNNTGEQDFRDPKVFWNSSIRKWNMVLAVGDHIRIFSSPDLKKWTFESDFKPEEDEEVGVWECPDLFQMAVAGSSDKKWVMLMSHGYNEKDNKQSGTRYFVGDFDGHTFKNTQQAQWIDVGSDFYAAATYANAPGNKRILQAWMSNWMYAQEVPATRWRSTMTLPRELALIKDKYVYAITQQWATQIINNQSEIYSKPESSDVELSGNVIPHCRITLDLEENNTTSIQLSNNENEVFTILIDGTTITTTRDVYRDEDAIYPFITETAASLPGERITKLDMIFDVGSCEILVNDGKLSMTTIYFPTSNFDKLSINPMDGGILRNVTIYGITPTMW
ncbi:MAG TPA: glycoside hydrolase family 32 protein [Chitinophagales bacterium]|nr:glycoside hydrolase family 32 protein [Chitinophagales bacterium]HMX03563.1 glycoside hydrolase family 32 protein [Chitinophagales bacterium]HNK99110.1 glycoside hydrolase family 32 protein [Chitinophagales bacterium]